MKFLNRHTEIKKIRTVLERPDPSLIILYGRRRCGKSTLLKQIKQKNDIYYQADLRDKRLQIEGLAKEIGLLYNGFSLPVYPDWESLLINLNKFLKKYDTLIVDEFPYLVKSNPELPSLLQKLRDNKKTNYNVIVCGSSQQMMHDIALNKNEPLYGRSDLILRLTGLKPGWMYGVISDNPVDLINEYAIWGGIPRYWEIRKNHPDFFTALKNEAFDKDSLLKEEPVRLLSDDLRSSVQAYSVLSLIGQGCHRLSEIASRLNKPATHLSKPLAGLINLGYVEREIPFGESEKNTKKGLYIISDPFFNFYFRFILPNKSRIELGLKQQVLNIYKKEMNRYTGHIWEQLCRASVNHLNIDNTEWDIAKRWWGKDIKGNSQEIDILAESSDKKTLLAGEVKWEEKTDIIKLDQELTHKCERLPFRGKYEKIVKAYWLKYPPEKSGNLTIITPKDVLSVLR